jgi:hypothetical protein
VSGSMHEALEIGRSDESAIERLRAMLCTALKLAQAEHRRNPHALMFVGVFGLNRDAGCPPGVDLCGVVDGLFDGRDDHRTGHELLIALTNQNNLAHITQYIRTKPTDDQARIIYIHLRRHSESVAEFVNAIPCPEQLQSFRTGSRWAGAGSAGTIGMVIGGPIGGLVGALIGGFMANTGAAIVEDHTVDHSDGLQLARRIWDK